MILTVIGARPQFIKAAVLSDAFKKAGIKEQIIHTGQHYDHKMSQVFFDELGLPGVTINLSIGSCTHGLQTAKMLTGIEKVLLGKKKDISALLVYGDTNSTIAGALAAVKLHIPVIHVEAGLRSFNKAMPEEVNRIMTDHVSDVLFCSSEVGKLQLSKEGITKGVHVCGDIMQDAFNTYSAIAERQLKVTDLLPAEIVNDYHLLTIHRPENTDAEIQGVLDGLGENGTAVVWPIHPRNKSRLQKLKVPSNVHVFEPFSYFEMMVVLKAAKKVLTDSGGLQKEAYWAKKPCVTIRPETEWVETLHNRWNILAFASKSAIIEAVNSPVNVETWIPLYGDGNAAKEIVNTIICTYFRTSK